MGRARKIPGFLRRRLLWLACAALLLPGTACAPREELPDPPEPPGPVTFSYRSYTLTALEGVSPRRFCRDGFRFDGEGRAFYTWKKRQARVGVDVSYYQKEIDWQAVAEDGIDFAILRLGYRGYTQGGIKTDSRFEENLQGARQAGLEVGVYFFSQATTPEEAREEADFVADTLGGRPVDYPVAFDWEFITSGSGARTDGMTGQALTACALAFCERVRERGYEPAVYFYQDLGYLYYDLAQLEGLPLWLAEYGGAPDFYYRFHLWQYTSSGRVAGIEGNVDLDLDLRGLEFPLRDRRRG